MLIKLARRDMFHNIDKIYRAGTSLERNFQTYPSIFADNMTQGAVNTGLLGALIGARARLVTNRKLEKKDRKSVGLAALKGAAVGATIGATIGVGMGHLDAGYARKTKAFTNANKYERQRYQRESKKSFDDDFFNPGRSRRTSDDDYFRMPPPAPKATSIDNMFKVKGFSTKKEAKSFHREMVRKNHPDAGGSEDAMKNVNKHWDEYNPHFEKLAKWIEKRAMDLSIVTPMAENAAIDSAASAMNTKSFEKRFRQPGLVQMPKFGGSNVINPSVANFRNV